MPDPNRYWVTTYDPETQLNGDPHYEVGVYVEDHALRVLLDDRTGDDDVGDELNLLIERHADKWLIIIHPHGGDPVCSVQIRDDGLARVEDGGGALLHEERVR